jgi:hypothetical protein
MNSIVQTPSNPQVTNPFHKVAECLYRHVSSDIYYALVKRGGKQFRQSLKTTDRQLANVRLKAYRDKVGRLSQSKHVNQITFCEIADRWLATASPGLKPSSARRKKTSVAQLKKFFGSKIVRNLAIRDCEDWNIKRTDTAAASTFNNE